MPRGRKPTQKKEEIIKTLVEPVSYNKLSIEQKMLEMQDQIAMAIAEGRGMVGVYNEIEAIKNRLIDLDRLEEKINTFIQKIEKINKK